MSDAPDPALTVSVAGGAVRGALHEGVRRFLAVPYAAPPVGDLRFQAPQPHAVWEGVRDATRPGPTAPQFVRDFPVLDVEPIVGDGWREGDDYLTLNVWAPAEPAATPRPVMVWVHGGAFALGSKDAAVTDGTAFAKSGVICVAITYRLGVEGFLPIPGGATNIGLRDILVALEWVRDNIAAFGGDPAQVTVFGESAGAMSIADLMTSPLAKGLFRRAIVQSGHGSMVRSLPVAMKLTRRVARILGVKATLEGFRTRSLKDGVDAVARVSTPGTILDLREADRLEPSYGLSKFLPVWGDDVLPEPPMQALAKGAGAEVELLIGTNREEMNLYFVPTGVKAALPRPLARLMLGRVQPKAGKVLAAYGWKDKAKTTGEVFVAAMHDLVFRWPARRFAETHRGATHVYEFGWRSPAVSGGLGACHGLEMPFVFKTLPCVTGAESGLAGPAPPQDLAERMHRLWVDFATTGALPWPEYRSADRQVYRPQDDVAEAEAPPPAAPFLP